MTQALNLANFANNLNTSGATSNAGLQNSAVTVSAGTGMSGGGAVSLGGTVTLTNAGVTSVTGAGTVSVSASTGSVTITGTGGSGTVTSVSGTNGLTGTVTTSGSLSVDTAFGNIGTSATLCNWSSRTFANGTVAGSSLGYWSSINGGDQGNPTNGAARRSGNVSAPGTGSTGYINTTAASGTWRSMSGAAGRSYDACPDQSLAPWGQWIRIS